ncbi:ABC transporter ATP-binding protein [Tissierellaceae bacterium HCP3S3_D8]
MIKIDRLKATYFQGFSLNSISMDIDRGEIVSLVGESGSGKTTFGKAVVGMLNKDAKVSGKVIIDGVDIYSISQSKFKTMQMRDFSICFQNSKELLNPLLTIEEHLYEVLIKKYDRGDIREEVIRLLTEVGLEEDILQRHPCELSGGMIQKILMIISICLKPKFVVLDEPTSSLDEESKEQIIQLIKNINREYNTSFLIITHDLTLAKNLSNRMAIIYGGNIVEIGQGDEILENPIHPYTRGLINSSMELNPYKDIWGIPNGENYTNLSGCPFFTRCNQRLESCEKTIPSLKKTSRDRNRLIACNRGGIIKYIEGNKITKSYNNREVLKDIDIELMAGETISLIGRSGIGKTTLLKILGGFLPPDYGEILFEGNRIDFRELHRSKYGLQVVFQDPTTSINPNMKIIDAVSEPLRLSFKQRDYIEETKKALKDVGLPQDDVFLNKKVKYLSGGQKQRISVARALTMEPKVLLADEPTSMLDVSSKANLLRLLKGIQNSKGFSMIIVTHDIISAVKISDRIYLLEKPNVIKEYRGEEIGEII